MPKTQVILVGQNKLFLQGLSNLLPQPRFEVLAHAEDARHLGNGLSHDLGPNDAQVVLIDLPNDREVIAREIKVVQDRMASAVVIVLVDTLDPQCLSASLAAGANGYLLKTIGVDALLHSIELACLGETVLPTKLAGLLVNGINEIAPTQNKSLGSFGLSDRETQILACLVAGNSNKMIANRLTITEATVKVHMKSLLRKIKVNNRTQAAIWAVNHGLAAPTSIAAE